MHCLTALLKLRTNVGTRTREGLTKKMFNVMAGGQVDGCSLESRRRVGQLRRLRQGPNDGKRRNVARKRPVRVHNSLAPLRLHVPSRLSLCLLATEHWRARNEGIQPLRSRRLECAAHGLKATATSFEDTKGGEVAGQVDGHWAGRRVRATRMKLDMTQLRHCCHAGFRLAGNPPWAHS